MISAALGKTGGGIGGVLYDRVREEAVSLKVMGIFYECRADGPHLCHDSEILKQSIARLRFYERYGARPIINNAYSMPVRPNDDNLYYLVFDYLGQKIGLNRNSIRKVVRVILERKYWHLRKPEYIESVVNSFQHDPAVIALTPLYS